MKAKRIAAIMLCLALLCTLCMPAALAAGYGDTAGHWAESSIERWSGYNIVEGYDGSFAPDDPLTRGQMAKILSNTLGLTESAENPFADVPADAWYAPFVLRCYAAGIMRGDGANANPEAAVTRQETMTMFCRALDIAPADGASLAAYADAGDVADWAAPYVAALTRAGIVNGVGGSLLAPGGSMTRAAFMTVLDRAVVQYINAPGSYTLTDRAGLILIAAGDVTLTGTTAANILVTPAASGKSVGFEKANVTGSITVKADNAKVTSADSTLPDIIQNGAGITVEKSDSTKPSGGSSGGGSGGGSHSPGGGASNLTVAEEKDVTSGTYQDVTITDAVGDGTVTLSNMTIRGNLYIKGGGSDSIKLNNVTLQGKIYMQKETAAAGGQQPRLELTNTPVARPIEVEKPAIIEATDAGSAVAGIEARDDVEIRGGSTSVAAVNVPAHTGGAVDVKVTAGTVTAVTAEGGVRITGDAGAVSRVTARAPVEIDRAGGVDSITVPAGVSGRVGVTLTRGEVEKVEVNGPASITGTRGSAGKVAAKADVTVTAGIVDTVEVPADAPEDVGIAVEGAGAVDVVVNSEKGVGITTGDNAGVDVSTELDKTPGVTVNGDALAHVHKWSAWTDDKNGNHTRTCSVDGCAAPTQTGAHKFKYVSDATAHWQECAVCGHATSAGGHVWGKWEYRDASTHGRECTVCGAAGTEAHAWDAGEMTRLPTATEAGEKTFTCAGCGGKRTETIPAAGGTAGTITLSLDETTHRLAIDFPRPDGYTNFGLYCYDSAGNEVGYSGIYDGFDPNVVLPCAPSSGKYTFVVAGWGSGVTAREIARLTDGVDITVAGAAVGYEMAFNTAENQHTATLSDPVPAGIWEIYRWFGSDGSYVRASGGSGSVSSTLIVNLALAGGEIFDLRILTAYALDGQTLKVTMTPASAKLYTPEHLFVDATDYRAILDDNGNVDYYSYRAWREDGTSETDFYVKDVDDKYLEAAGATSDGTYSGLYTINARNEITAAKLSGHEGNPAAAPTVANPYVYSASIPNPDDPSSIGKLNIQGNMIEANGLWLYLDNVIFVYPYNNIDIDNCAGAYIVAEVNDNELTGYAKTIYVVPSGPRAASEYLFVDALDYRAILDDNGNVDYYCYRAWREDGTSETDFYVKDVDDKYLEAAGATSDGTYSGLYTINARNEITAAKLSGHEGNPAAPPTAANPYAFAASVYDSAGGNYKLNIQGNMIEANGLWLYLDNVIFVYPYNNIDIDNCAGAYIVAEVNDNELTGYAKTIYVV